MAVNTGSLVADPNGQGVRLTLSESDSGTKISSTRYVHYGTIDFVLESSKWAGVVTAAITMSDVKDEIDWEWPGTTTDAAQTNYWFMGIANCMLRLRLRYSSYVMTWLMSVGRWNRLGNGGSVRLGRFGQFEQFPYVHCESTIPYALSRQS